MKKFVSEGEIRPKGYAMAYLDVLTLRYVCYPVGIHWLVQIWQRIIYLTHRAILRDKYEVQMNAQYRKGYDVGYEHGKRHSAELEELNEAFTAGWQASSEAALALVRENPTCGDYRKHHDRAFFKFLQGKGR